MSSSATTRSLDPDLRATHGQLGEFGMGNYVTLKPPNLGKNLIVDSATTSGWRMARSASKSPPREAVRKASTTSRLRALSVSAVGAARTPARYGGRPSGRSANGSASSWSPPTWPVTRRYGSRCPAGRGHRLLRGGQWPRIAWELLESVGVRGREDCDLLAARSQGGHGEVPGHLVEPSPREPASIVSAVCKTRLLYARPGWLTPEDERDR